MQHQTHIMIDIETLGTGKDAAIVGIGAVVFDPTVGSVGNGEGQGFSVHIDVTDSNHLGQIDPATVLWWLQQSDEARAALTSPNVERVPLGEALTALAAFINENGGKKAAVWANDPDFDLSILDSAYRRYSLPLPWSYRGARSMRTMCWLARELELDTNVERGGVQHDALDDAVYQAMVVGRINMQLRDLRREAAV